MNGCVDPWEMAARAVILWIHILTAQHTASMNVGTNDGIISYGNVPLVYN